MYIILSFFIFIIILWNSLSFHIYNCFIGLSFFSYLSLFYIILFLFMFIIVLLCSFSFHIYHCFMKFSLFSYLSLFYEIPFIFIFIIVLWYSFDINECPLSIAIKTKSIEIVQFLVDHGADVNSFFSYLSLFYEILFLFILIIVL